MKRPRTLLLLAALLALSTLLPVAREISRSIKAHWATKHNSAIVATERPTTTLESQVSKMTMRCTSYTGKAERKAHPDT